jgi:hypothetical protein
MQRVHTFVALKTGGMFCRVPFATGLTPRNGFYSITAHIAEFVYPAHLTGLLSKHWFALHRTPEELKRAITHTCRMVTQSNEGTPVAKHGRCRGTVSMHKHYVRTSKAFEPE